MEELDIERLWFSDFTLIDKDQLWEISREALRQVLHEEKVMKSTTELSKDWLDTDIDQMTETAIREEARLLSDLLKNQDATPRQADRLTRLRRAIDRLNEARRGYTR